MGERERKDGGHGQSLKWQGVACLRKCNQICTAEYELISVAQKESSFTQLLHSLGPGLPAEALILLHGHL